jgi:hypothetical protein
MKRAGYDLIILHMNPKAYNRRTAPRYHFLIITKLWFLICNEHIFYIPLSK